MSALSILSSEPGKSTNHEAWALKKTLRNSQELQSFNTFLEKEYANENLTFYLAVERLKEIPADDPQFEDVAKTLYEDFISRDAEASLNLTGKIIKEIQTKLECSPISPDLFDQAQREVFELMQNDPFPRFLNQYFYQTIDNAITKNSLGVDPRFFHRIFHQLHEELEERWTMTKAKKGIKCCAKPVSSPRKPVPEPELCFRTKASVNINTDAQRIHDFIWNWNYRSQWDPHFQSAVLVEKMAYGMELLRITYRKPQCFMKRRDFCAVRLQHIPNNNHEKSGDVNPILERNPGYNHYDSFISLLKSVVHPKVPPEEGVLRAEIESSFIITPQGGRSIVTHFGKFDIGGGPHWLQRKIASEQPLSMLASLKQILEGSETLSSPLGTLCCCAPCQRRDQRRVFSEVPLSPPKGGSEGLSVEELDKHPVKQSEKCDK